MACVQALPLLGLACNQEAESKAECLELELPSKAKFLDWSGQLSLGHDSKVHNTKVTHRQMG